MNAREPYNVKSKASEFINSINEIANYSELKRLRNFSSIALTKLIEMISQKLGIANKIEKWCLNNYKVYKFKRIILENGINSKNDFDKIWNENPFSMSTYFGKSISYTLETPDRLP